MIFVSFIKKFINLFLKISWLYSVNATISIKKFKIKIENPKMSEKIQTVQKSLFIFSFDHKILMHSVFNYQFFSIKKIKWIRLNLKIISNSKTIFLI